MRIRIAGAALAAIAMVAIVALHTLAIAGPPHEIATVPELLLAALAVIAGLPGLGMLVEGPGIFGTCDRPRRG